MKKIIVAGSSNVDFTARVSSLPKPGETIGGAKLMQANGGKGANQAVAAARLGADVLFVTCLGND
ncbi:MAG: ribokinase, partial [Bacteroidales bacterium]|nr:ribokinase [Bacteroidales bacterium]